MLRTRRSSLLIRPERTVWSAGPHRLRRSPAAGRQVRRASRATLLRLAADDLAGGGVEDDGLEVRPGVEVEQAAERRPGCREMAS